MPEASADVNADGSAYIGDSDPDSTPGGRAWLDVMGKLSVGVNNLTAELADAKQRAQDALAHVPNNVSIPRFSVNATATDLLNFGGPRPGREWVVRLLSGVAVPLAANATLATWYVGQPIPSDIAPGQYQADVVWQFASLPSFQSFTSDVIHIKPGENLFVGLTGIPATSRITIVARVDDQLLWDTKQR
jgi:hypothetical protein